MMQPGLDPYGVVERRPPRRLLRAAVIVPVILGVLLYGAVGFGVVQYFRPALQPSSAAPRWQPYVDDAKQFAVVLTTISPQTIDSDIQRILDGSTGPFHDDFANKRSDYTQTVVKSSVTTQGTVNSAGLESINGTTAHVLVAVTVASKVTNNDGASQEPRNMRLVMQVDKLGDAYKVSKVEFTP
jgi:serine/threonine-protein kinase